MGEANHVLAPGMCVRVERRRFHLHDMTAGIAGRSYSRFGLAVRRVCRPGGPGIYFLVELRERWDDALGELGAEGAPGPRRNIVQARALVSPCLLDEQVVGRVGQRRDLAGGGDAYDEFASAAASCSATSTANGAPTAHPTTPKVTPACSAVHNSVW